MNRVDNLRLESKKMVDCDWDAAVEALCPMSYVGDEVDGRLQDTVAQIISRDAQPIVRSMVKERRSKKWFLQKLLRTNAIQSSTSAMSSF